MKHYNSWCLSNCCCNAFDADNVGRTLMRKRALIWRLTRNWVYSISGFNIKLATKLCRYGVINYVHVCVQYSIDTKIKERSVKSPYLCGIFSWIFIKILYTWVRASWIEFNNFPTRCNLFSLLHFCRQLYMLRVLTPIIRSSYNCKYSFWYWLTRSTIIHSRCWVGTDSCVSCIDTHEWLINTRSCIYSCTNSWWWVPAPATCRAAYRYVINGISRIFLENY